MIQVQKREGEILTALKAAAKRNEDPPYPPTDTTYVRIILENWEPVDDRQGQGIFQRRAQGEQNRHSMILSHKASMNTKHLKCRVLS